MKFLAAAIAILFTPTIAEASDVDYLPSNAYDIEWEVMSVPADGRVFTVKRGDALLSERLIPLRLFSLKSPIISENGANLVDKGEWFVSMKSASFLACTPMIRIEKQNKNTWSGVQVCVLDTNGDGKFDTYFKSDAGIIQSLFVQSTIYKLKTSRKKFRALNGVEFDEHDRNTDIGLPLYSIKFLGGMGFSACLGNGLVGKEFGCIETASYWIENDKRVSVSGAQFDILNKGGDGSLTLKFVSGLPNHKFVILPGCLLCTRP